MIKAMLAFAIGATLCCPVAIGTSTKASARSYEECHALAVSRGIRPGKRAERYTMLQGYGHKTKPQGLIARCMAGQKV